MLFLLYVLRATTRAFLVGIVITIGVPFRTTIGAVIFPSHRCLLVVDDKDADALVPEGDVHRIEVDAVDVLAGAIRGIAETLTSAVAEETLVQEKIVTLEEKIREVVELIGRLDRESFRSMSRTKSRSEIIVTFLALLHLAREQFLVIEQDGAHSDIIITRPPAAPAEADSPTSL